MSKDVVLVVAAHADDETLGCGGAIQKHAAAGDNVHLCVVTEGWSYSHPDYDSRSRQKEEHCRSAAALLGVAEVVFLNLKTLSLGSPEAHANLNSRLEELFTHLLPTVVYTPSMSDVNQDHIAVCRSVEVVCRPGRQFVRGLRRVLAYEILSSSEWARTSVFQPNVFLDIEPYLEGKIRALQCYTTEVRPYPHPRSPEGVGILAQYRGLQSGMRAAEAFRLLVAYE